MFIFNQDSENQGKQRRTREETASRKIAGDDGGNEHIALSAAARDIVSRFQLQ